MNYWTFQSEFCLCFLVFAVIGKHLLSDNLYFSIRIKKSVPVPSWPFLLQLQLTIKKMRPVAMNIAGSRTVWAQGELFCARDVCLFSVSSPVKGDYHARPHHLTKPHSTAQHTAHSTAALYSAAHHSTAQRNATQRNTAQRNATQHSTAQHSTGRLMMWCGLIYIFFSFHVFFFVIGFTSVTRTVHVAPNASIELYKMAYSAGYKSSKQRTGRVWTGRA